MSERTPSQADELVVAARESGELFHDPDGIAYADVVAPEPAEHHEILRVRSRTFRTWLAGRYWRANGRPAGGQALTDAIDVLSSLAQFEGPEKVIGFRLAKHRGAIYLDLVDDRWRVVEIDTVGWRILDRSPVPFRRARGMRPLPVPVHGGKLNELREFLNLADDEQYHLLAGWLIGTFRPSGPYIVLVLTGEQDSAKSTHARVLRSLVDPHEIPERTLPRDEQTMAIGALNNWIVSFDNVSNLDGWQSDALARLATGAGFGTRQLYSDDEEFLIRVSRPVILNGIGGIITRPDLMDRAVIVDLKAIPEAGRIAEEAFYPALAAARPRLLGALLHAVAVAFDREDQVVSTVRPRMWDAARWITASEGALGWPARSFLNAYVANRKSGRIITLEASPLAAPIRLLLQEADTWSGTATELLKQLEKRVDEAVTKRKDWPKTAQLLGVDLRRLAPDLRKVEDVEVVFPNRHGNGRLLQLARVGKPLSQPSEASREQSEQDNGDNADNDLHTRTNGSYPLPWPVDDDDDDHLDPETLAQFDVDLGRVPEATA